MPLPMMAMFRRTILHATAAGAGYPIAELASRRRGRAETGGERRCGFALPRPRIAATARSHSPAGRWEVVLRASAGCRQAENHRDGDPFPAPSQTRAVGKTSSARLARRHGGAPRAGKGQPVRHGADQQHHPIASLQLRHRRSAAGGFTGRGLVAITRSTGAASTCPWSRYSRVPARGMIRSAKQPVSAATGVPVCHIEQAYADVGAELLERCQARRIAPLPQAMTRWPSAAKDFARAGADPGAGAGDGYCRHRPAHPPLHAAHRQPAGKMLVDHLPGVVVVALMENLLPGDVHHRAARQG